jgi:hypothetical protein
MLTKIASGCALAIALRTDSGTKTSVVRVITVRNPAPCKNFCKRNAVSSATSFSGALWLGIPPRSRPPWPGSITTVENGTSARASAITMNGMTIAAKKVCRRERVPPLPGQRGNPRKKLPSRFCSSSSSRKAIVIISDLFILMPFFNSEDMNNSLEDYGTLAVRPTGTGNDALPHV